MKPLKAAALILTLLMPVCLSAAQSSYQLIEQAFQAGGMSNEERLILLVQSIRSPESLPDRFRADVPEIEKSATDSLLEVAAEWDNFDEDQQGMLRQLLARPSATHSIVSPSGKFRIHYNISGGDAVPGGDTNPPNGIPDYVDWLADYADSSYRTEVVNLGQMEPPSDFSGGGDSRYDIYTEDMYYYGYTQPEGYGDRPWTDYYSYVSVENNFYGFPPNDDPEGDQKGAMKVTVAHEYYHAIQLGYEVNMGTDVWFMEISSTWMEEWAFPTVNDNYNYLSDFFSYPYYSLHSTSGLHAYGAFVWAKYLEENFGAAIMEEIWDHTIGSYPYDDLEFVLAVHGSSLEDEFSKFCIWNYITSSYDDGLHYEDASDYPMVQIMRTHSSYPVSNQSPSSTYRPDAMGANYVRFYLPGGEGVFTLDFDGQDGNPWRVKVLKYVYSGGPVFSEHEMVLDANGAGEFEISDPEDWSQVVMIACNLSQTQNDRTYVYNAQWLPWTGYEIDITRITDDSVYSASWCSTPFQIQNIGAQPDDFLLHVSDELGWSLSPNPASIYLEPGEFDTVAVTVNCPGMTMEGVANRVSLQAEASSAINVVDEDSCYVHVFVMRGDADNNSLINVSDITYDIQFVFADGPAPVPIEEAGDADCSGNVNVSDIVYLIDFVFGTGSAPVCNPL
jgi:hypothetical protein